MEGKKRYTFINILIVSVWILLGAGTIVLLIAAVKKKESERCKSVEINISGVQNNLFIDKKDVIQILESVADSRLEGKSASSFNLSEMESVLEKNSWVKDAELFFDNNEVLKIRITEREPIARIFTSAGTSFYIDTSVTRLPLSDKFSARLPVFTNYPSIKNQLSKADSSLLIDIKNIGEYIMEDSFWMAQIDQVDITSQRSFEMIPKIGNQVIDFGNGENYVEKFSNLLLFYKEVQSKIGWSKYSRINMQYKGQVVCIKRGAGEIKMDSIKTRQLMQTLVANAQKQANDSSNIQLIQQQDDNVMPLPAESDDDIPAEDATIYKQLLNIKNDKEQLKDSPHVSEKLLPQTITIIKPENKPTITVSSNTKYIKKTNPVPAKKINNIKPQSVKPAEKPETKPKALMPPKNDY